MMIGLVAIQNEKLKHVNNRKSMYLGTHVYVAEPKGGL
jgi:hypothetical protein